MVLRVYGSKTAVCVSLCVLSCRLVAIPLLLTILPDGSLKDPWLRTLRLQLRPHLKQLAGGNLLIFNEPRQVRWLLIVSFVVSSFARWTWGCVCACISFMNLLHDICLHVATIAACRWFTVKLTHSATHAVCTQSAEIFMSAFNKSNIVHLLSSPGPWTPQHEVHLCDIYELCGPWANMVKHVTLSVCKLNLDFSGRRVVSTSDYSS